jgi:adenylate cyclase
MMSKEEPEVYGELKPIGGGDPIPLLKTKLIIGRRESCDIVLRFPNVSGKHCELFVSDGGWVVKDLGSSNGTKVDGTQVEESPINSGGVLSIAKHKYEISYNTSKIQISDRQVDIFSKSLLSSAGLENRRF